MNNKSAFTLLEMIIVLALLGALAAIYFANISPGTLFTSARNVQRTYNLGTIASGIQIWQIQGEQLSSLTTNSSATITHCDEGSNEIGSIGDDRVDLINQLVPQYLPEFPVDPLNDPEDYSATGFYICRDEKYFKLIALKTEGTAALVEIIRVI